MSNPIQQAIEAIEQARTELEQYEEDATGEHYNSPRLNAALSALQSLQGVELPDLPPPFMAQYGRVSSEVYAPWAKQMKAYARTAVAAAMARGAGAQPDEYWIVRKSDTEVFQHPAYGPGIFFTEDASLSAAPTPEATQPTQAEREVTSREHSVLMSAARRSGKVVHDATQADPICSKCRWPLNAHDTGEPCQPTQAEAPSERKIEPLTMGEIRALMSKHGIDFKNISVVSALIRDVELEHGRGGAALATQQAGQGEAANSWASGIGLAVIGRKHFGNPIPQQWYAAARELVEHLRAPQQPETLSSIDYWQRRGHLGQPAEWREACRLFRVRCSEQDIAAMAKLRAYLEEGLLEARRPEALAQQEREPMTDAQIEKLREATFSTNNPFCPVDSKSMRKAVRAAESFHRIRAARSSEGGGK